MATHKDAEKRHRQSERRRVQNRAYRTQMRNQVKTLRAAVEAGDSASAQDELKSTMSVIHRLASKGVIPKNRAARKIHRLHEAVKGIDKK